MEVKQILEEEVARLRELEKRLQSLRDCWGAANAKALADGISYAIGVISGAETAGRIREEARVTGARIALMQ